MAYFGTLVFLSASERCDAEINVVKCPKRRWWTCKEPYVRRVLLTDRLFVIRFNIMLIFVYKT